MPTWAMSAASAIRRAWFGLVLPALILNYFGQGALILAEPTAADSPFYKLAPSMLLIPMVVLAALATIIASQSLISGVFSLTRQAMMMGLCPRTRIVATSSDEEGQIYVPAANWLLMAGTLFTVILFRTSDNLAAAYGIAVSGTMLTTTILLYRVAVTRWAWSPAVACSDHRGIRRDRRDIPGVQLDEVRGRRLVSSPHRRGDRGHDAVVAQRRVGGQRAAPRDVDAARPVHSVCGQNGHRPGARNRRLAHQSRAWGFADAAAPYRAQSRPA